jgi:predicted RNA-binding protein with PUA-like domain
MAHWLYKSEPSTWSWDQQVAAGEKGTSWDGVRNHQAKQNLMAMRLGDRGFFYHSNEGKAVVGIVEVIREYYPDHTDETGKFGMVDVKAHKKLKKPVTLATIKADPELADLALVRQSRLSVMPIDAKAWAKIVKLGGGMA